jgi:hypothetical protein
MAQHRDRVPRCREVRTVDGSDHARAHVDLVSAGNHPGVKHPGPGVSSCTLYPTMSTSPTKRSPPSFGTYRIVAAGGTMTVLGSGVARVRAVDGGIPMLEDLDPAETREWVDALDSVMAFEGADRRFFLLDEVIEEARRRGAPVPYSATTPYLNTIPPDKEDRLDRRNWSSTTASGRSSGGMPWRSSCAPTRSPRSSAAISRASSPRRRSTTSASSTFFTPRPIGTAETCSSSRAIPRPASTPVRLWRAGSPRIS